MSTLSSAPAVTAMGSDTSATAVAKRARRRRVFWVWFARLLFAVLVIGGWQLFTALKIVDPFFYGQPSGIWKETVDLFEHGTEFGSFWIDIATTLQEAVYGFGIGQKNQNALRGL